MCFGQTGGGTARAVLRSSKSDLSSGTVSARMAAEPPTATMSLSLIAPVRMSWRMARRSSSSPSKPFLSTTYVLPVVSMGSETGDAATAARGGGATAGEGGGAATAGGSGARSGAGATGRGGGGGAGSTGFGAATATEGGEGGASPADCS